MITKGNGKKAVLMLHGRGSNGEDMIKLSNHFNATCYALTAQNNEWYPAPFINPRIDNEPKFSESLSKIHEIVSQIKKDHAEVYILGFSQGACIALEYGALYDVSGVIAFSGGFLGKDKELPQKVEAKKALICCSTNDPFIPLKRAKDTADIYSKYSALVITNFYEGNSHSISNTDLELAKAFVNNY